MKTKCLRVWQDRLEEAEDRSFQHQAEMAQTNYRCFYLNVIVCVNCLFNVTELNKSEDFTVQAENMNSKLFYFVCIWFDYQCGCLFVLQHVFADSRFSTLEGETC